MYGSSLALAIASAARQGERLILALTPDVQGALKLPTELGCFLADIDTPVLGFPDWETLP